MFERKSMKWPILLAIVMIVLLVVLTVGWILLNVFNAIGIQSGSSTYWVLLSVGSIMFGFVLTGVILYLVWTIQNINLNRRQSNFIDAVTHELKTPIASLKLFLQTLNRRNIDEEQRKTFYRSMLEDVERLDQLITQLLDVARLQQKEVQTQEPTWNRIDVLADNCIRALAIQYQFEPEAIQTDCVPCEVLAHHVDIEILLRNLIDNAIKYSSKPMQVGISIQLVNSQATIIVSDNGPGVPRHLRRKIFHRFYRIGSELERKKPGTGLGLFLVRSIVKRLHGSIKLLDTPKNSGSRFQIILPNCRPASSSMLIEPNE